MTNRPLKHFRNRGSDNPTSRRRGAVAFTSLLGAAALMLAACGSHSDIPSPSQRAQNEAPLIAYAKCMRSRGVRDFPDPSVNAAGGIGYSNAQAQAINQDGPAYQAAETACQNLPGATSAQQLLTSHN